MEVQLEHSILIGTGHEIINLAFLQAGQKQMTNSVRLLGVNTAWAV